MSRSLHSIHNRLFILFLFCMAGIVLLVSILFYNRTTTQFHEKLGEIAQKNVSQTVGLLDLLLGSYDSLSKSISANVDIVRLLGQKSASSPQVEYINQNYITTIMGAIYFSRDDLVGIHVIGENGKIYDYSNSMNVIDPEYTKSSWYQQISGSSGQMVWLGVFPHSIIDQVEDQPVFAFGRPIFNLNEQHQIGIVLIEARADTFLTAMNNLKLGPHSEVNIVTGDGKHIPTSIEPNSKPGTIPPHISLPQIPGQVNVQQNNSRLIAASKLGTTNWTIVSSTPDRDLNVELTQTKRYLFIVVTVLIVVSALIAFIVSRTISSPLKRLIREMKQVENGNFRGMVTVTSYEEINSLVLSFNHMVARIEELIERVKVSSVSEKNAELHALQSQVNPHFLYNTLDMIYWMLDEKGNDELGDVVLSLSHMFRYSSHWEDHALVTLREEIEQINHYLTIILIRLDGRLSVEIDVEEQWMDLHVPKMLLQPIIENAVKHGLEALDRPGILRVRAIPDRKYLNIIISDNGKGMNESTLERLRDSLLRPTDPVHRERKSIGLQNLHQRLSHMFGITHGIQIESSLGTGTAVKLVLPLSDQSSPLSLSAQTIDSEYSDQPISIHKGGIVRAHSDYRR
ncbi:cache domain-containing sensor histidine kinase [Paenibacillus nuruki]|uniref:cache domain-containing sensor histidine kinase n=1 Tax=Paenibacillus nuruki TaxID=1886670 RepID=UPI0029221F52|nr:histidine kinase [Paenibacillus nuruki]